MMSRAASSVRRPDCEAAPFPGAASAADGTASAPGATSDASANDAASLLSIGLLWLSLVQRDGVAFGVSDHRHAADRRVVNWRDVQSARLHRGDCRVEI